MSPERGNTPLPLPQPELDPDTLRSDLRDFLQELREAQRERVIELRRLRKMFKVNINNNSGIFWCLVYGSISGLLLILKDDARCQLGGLRRELEELSGGRESALIRLTHLENMLQECQEGKNIFFYLSNVNLPNSSVLEETP